MRSCVHCHNSIPPSRLAALPHTTSCVDCSTEQPVKGWIFWNHKTAPTFQIVTPEQHAWLTEHDRPRPAASLPFSSRSASVDALSRNPTPSTPPVAPTVNTTMIPRARCGHSERPQVGPSGKCVECAVQYYAIRAKWAGQ